MQRRILLSLISIAFLFYSTSAVALNKELSILSSSDSSSTVTGITGDTVTVNIVIDNASVVAGAAFTVLYDTASLSLTETTSSFFGTFISQGIATPDNQSFVTVAGKDYNGPIASNTVNDLVGAITTGTLIAAARFNDGSGIDIVLFTLTFKLIGMPGTYDVSIKRSEISNKAAGYDENGELMPYLVGVGDSGNPYPSHLVLVTNGCSIVINPDPDPDPDPDTDDDGIEDAWERTHVPEGTLIEVKETRVRGEEGRPKTKGSVRDIKMLPPVRDALKDLKNKATPDSPYVFLSRNGTPLLPNSINYHTWKPALKKAGLKPMSLYQTRHTFATLMLDAGELPGWVQSMMGHESLKMILEKYYSHIQNYQRDDGSSFMVNVFSPRESNQGVSV